MELISQILLAILICGAVIAVMWSMRGIMLTPVGKRKGVETFTVVKIDGEADGLEQTIKGLMWLRDAGKTDTKIIIAVDNITRQAMKRAEILSENCGGEVCLLSELPDRLKS